MNKPPAVPYCTVKGFRKCLDILRQEPPRARIDRQVLVERGLSPHAVYPVLGALRFLRLVDEDGGVSPDLDAFLRDDVVTKQAVVAEAYGDILRDVQFPVEDREEVDRILVERHDCAPGVAAFCSTFFLWLAAEAGMPVAVMGRHRRGRPPAHLSQLSVAARTLLQERVASMPAAATSLAASEIFERGGERSVTDASVTAAPPARRGATSEAP